MNIFCIAINSGDSDPTAVIEAAFPDHAHKIFEGTWVVASEKLVCSEVSDLVNLKQGGSNVGIVVKLDEYYGFYDRALWEKINEWRDQ